MKKVAIITFCAALMISGCSGTKCDIDNVSTKGRVETAEKWQWVKTTGGIAGVTITPESCGNSGYIYFCTNGTAAVKMHYNKEQTYHYAFRNGKSTLFGDKYPLLYLSTESDGINETEQIVLSKTNDEMVLADDFYDGFTNEYKRIK